MHILIVNIKNMSKRQHTPYTNVYRNMYVTIFYLTYRLKKQYKFLVCLSFLIKLYLFGFSRAYHTRDWLQLK